MAASVDSSKFFIPFMPSLWHRAVAKYVLQFYNKFDYNFLKMAIATINDEVYPISAAGCSTEDSRRNYIDRIGVKLNRAKEIFYPIPPDLRKKVLQVTFSLQDEVLQWHDDHFYILKGTVDCVFYWRDDGTIDVTKTAQELIKDDTIPIKKRFEIACMYCFEESIRSLWMEMQLTGLTENYDERNEMTNNCLTRFWVRWIRDGCRVPWIQAAREYLDPPPYRGRSELIPMPRVFLPLEPEGRANPIPRFSSFFHLLQPADRQKFLSSLKDADFDDFRFCLYAMTRDEEEQIKRTESLKIVKLYLNWPLQSIFLKTVENLYDYMDVEQFRWSLVNLKHHKYNKPDFDYGKLLDDFWDSSPDHLKKDKNSAVIYEQHKKG